MNAGCRKSPLLTTFLLLKIKTAKILIIIRVECVLLAAEVADSVFALSKYTLCLLCLAAWMVLPGSTWLGVLIVVKRHNPVIRQSSNAQVVILISA